MDDLAPKPDGAFCLFLLAIVTLLLVFIIAAGQDLFQAALTALKAERFEEAVNLLQRLSESEPGRAEVHGMLGVALDGAGRFQEAEKAYLRALALAPGTPGFHNNLALHYQRRGDGTRALEYFEKELQIAPASATALFNLSRIQLALGRYEDALRTAEKARRAHPGDPGMAHTFFHARGALLARQKKFVEAERDLLEALRLGETAEVRFELGWTYYELTRFEEAEEQLQKAAQVNPIAGHLLSLGYLQIRNSHYAAAKATLARFLDLQPESPLGHYYLGIAREYLRELESAEKSFQRALELDPSFAYAFIHLGKIAYQQQRYPEALERLQKAIALHPRHAEAYFQLGNVLRALGRLEEAQEAFRTFQELRSTEEERPLFRDKELCK